MTAGSSSAGPVGEQDPPRPRSETALADYTARMRRARLRYAAAICAVLVAIAVVVAVAWSHGEAAHTILRTAPTPAPSVPLRTPAATVTAAWSSTDHTAIGTPYWGGTVITYSAHTVSGRNARTGATTWSYRRSDRTVCQAIQTAGVTVAIYRIKGDCQEVTALDSGTGHRLWTRTLFENGYPIVGNPAYQVTPNSIMMTTPSVIYLINATAGGPDPGDDIWMFAQTGCTIHGAVFGTAGALISQTCVNPNCSGLKYCHAGPQLLLRDPSAAYSDSGDQKSNPDRILWNLAGNTDVPVSAGSDISAYAPGGHALHVFSKQKGTPVRSLHLQPPPATVSSSTVSTVDTTDRMLVWSAGIAYSIGNQPPVSVQWSARTSGPLTVTATDHGQPPDVTNAIVAAPVARGVGLLDPDTGTPRRVVSIPDVAAGDAAYPLGAGFLIAGASTRVYR